MIKKNTPARPDMGTVKGIAEEYISEDFRVEPVLEGKSTFVYRLLSETETKYMRFLPEEASFGAEILVHEKLLALGVSVPEILAWEEKNEETGLSLMIIREIPGQSIEKKAPVNDGTILREAGRQLALIHTVSVDGFGWIDRKVPERLTGEKKSFLEYYGEYLDHDLRALDRYPFSENEKKVVRNLIGDESERLNGNKAVLVHGDFDISHIFHKNGLFTGFIDFGEIRGNNRLFDLATFVGFNQDRDRLARLMEGYREIASFDEDDLFGAETMALFMLLRHLGKNRNPTMGAYWFGIMKRQLEALRLA